MQDMTPIAIIVVAVVITTISTTTTAAIATIVHRHHHHHDSVTQRCLAKRMLACIGSITESLLGGLDRVNGVRV